MPEIPLTLSVYETRSKPFSAQRLVNLYAAPAEGRAKSRAILYGTPGRTQFCDTGVTSGCRGALAWKSFPYFCVGETLVRLDGSGNATIVGSVPGTGPVSMTADPNYLVIANGTERYTWDGATFEAVSDTDLVPGHTIAFLDGYTIGDQGGTNGRWQWSDFGNPRSYDPVKFATAESSPDVLKAVAVANRIIWLFGETTIERWRNAGTSTPWQRLGQQILEIGLAAVFSVARYRDTLFFVGTTQSGGRHVFEIASSGEARAISNDGIDLLLESGSVGDAEGWCYAQEGHAFYVLTLPGADRTLVYDIKTGLWHERMTGTGGADEKGRWNAAWHCVAFDRHLVGDAATGKIYELRLDAYQDDGTEMISIVTTPPLGKGERRNSMRDLWLDIEPGLAADCRVMMSHSDDGGKTFSRERVRNVGPQGAFQTRALWRQMPSFRTSRILKFKISDTVPRRILALYTEGGPGIG